MERGAFISPDKLSSAILASPLPTFTWSRSMLKSKLLDAILREIYRHGFDTFVDEPPTTARGGNGVVVTDCPACKKRLQSMNEFLRHLAEDAMPPLLDRLSKQ